ncbi:MAG: DUF6262 family protein [Acidimicrobiales bacterium]
MTDDRRADVLRRAAAAKRAAATARAEAGLRALLKGNAEINFRAVAIAAGVSVDFLYRHAELRPRIEQLRARQRATPPAASPATEPAGGGDSTVVATLTAKLRHARSEVADLRAQLAVAHGELLALRRQVPVASDR